MRRIAPPMLIGFLALSFCPAVLAAEMEGTRYECQFISRGDNQPDFEINDDLLKSLIVSLHQRVSPAAFQKKSEVKSSRSEAQTATISVGPVPLTSSQREGT